MTKPIRSLILIYTMTNNLIILPILLPLVVGGIQVLIRSTTTTKPTRFFIQRITNLIGFLILLAICLYLFFQVKDGERLVYLTGNWVAPFGIVYVLDSLSALMILLSAILAFLVLIYSWQSESDISGENFHPFLALQFFGINGAFLTGDIFNLFVFFEVLLIASYALLVHSGGKKRTRAGLHYLVINLIASALFLIGVATIYGIVGTLNIADLAQKISEINPSSYGIVAGAAIILVIVFGIKAAMFPLYFWLPQSYPQALAPIAALFAIMTKVGIYSIIRVHGLIFNQDAGKLAFIHIQLILVMGIITAIIAAFGVISTGRLRVQAAYLILASVATLLIGIGINSPNALAGTLFYLIHSIFIGAAIFIWVDVISKSRGEIDDQILETQPFRYIVFIGVVYVLITMSICGLPPLSGFIGKILILDAAFITLKNNWAILVSLVIVITGLINLIALTRGGTIVFYKADRDGLVLKEKKYLSKKYFILPIILFCLSPIMMIFAGSITKFTSQVAKQHYNYQAYIDNVFATKAKTSPKLPKP